MTVHYESEISVDNKKGTMPKYGEAIVTFHFDEQTKEYWISSVYAGGIDITDILSADMEEQVYEAIEEILTEDGYIIK